MNVEKYGFKIEARAPSAEMRITRPYESAAIVMKMLKSLSPHVSGLKIDSVDTNGKYYNYEVTWAFRIDASQYEIAFSSDAPDSEKSWCAISDMSNPSDDTACADIIWDGREIRPAPEDVHDMKLVLRSH
jgi:hypothetical protein